MIRFLLILFISLSSFGQDNHDEMIHKFLEQRKQMMEEMMKAFGDDDFFKDDFNEDKVFEQLKKHGLGGFGTFKSSGSNVSVEEKIKSNGNIDIIITPKNENIDLNIETKNNRISIKSEVRVEEKNEGQSGTSQFMQSSQYSQIVSIPEGYKAQSPKQVDKSIVITLIPKKGNPLKPNKDGKTPIEKKDGEKVI